MLRDNDFTDNITVFCFEKRCSYE